MDHQYEHALTPIFSRSLFGSVLCAIETEMPRTHVSGLEGNTKTKVDSKRTNFVSVKQPV